MAGDLKLSEGESVLGQFMGFVLTEKRILLTGKNMMEVLFLKHVEFASLEIVNRISLIVLGVLLILLGLILDANFSSLYTSLNYLLLFAGIISIIFFFLTRKQYLTFGTGNQKLKTMIKSNKKAEAIDFINLVTSKL